MNNSKLKTITDNTVSKLLRNEVILPSTYFQTFQECSDELNLNISDNEFKSEVTKTIQDDMNKLHELVHKTTNNMEKFTQETTKAQEAINNNDKDSLSAITNEINTLQKEMFELMDQIYIDSLTNNKNRKWLYHKYLNNKDILTSQGVLIYIDLNDIKYINESYGELLGNNLIRYVSTTLNQKLTQEQIEYKMINYCSDKFLILIQNNDIQNITSIISSVRTKVLSTTLKSNSGILLKAKFSFGIVKFFENDNFHEILEKAHQLEEDDRNELEA
jgi:diguanylate cyclase (GGDEF)-like protein